MKKGTASLLIILACIAMSACGKEDIIKLETSKQHNTVYEQEQTTNKRETNIENVKDGKSQVNLYINIIQNYLSEGKTDFSVAFINLNNDDIKEMVVIFGDTQLDGGYLYTIKDGAAIQVLASNKEYFGQYGGFSYLEKGNIFITENESTTDSQISHSIVYYSMENGEAICKDKTESVTVFDSDQSIYYVNGKQVESVEYDSIAGKYDLAAMSTVKYSEGIHVVDNDMEKIYKAYNQK